MFYYFFYHSILFFQPHYERRIYYILFFSLGLELVTTLKGHTGSICCLCWDSQKQLLFSGSFDQSIIVWDIGGQKGTAFELQGHKEKVQSVMYIPENQALISASDDCTVGVWDLRVQRNEVRDQKKNIHIRFTI